MTSFSPALDAALQSDAPLVFGAVSVSLPGYTLNLLDGAGSLTIGGQTFVGQDDTYGVLSEIEDLTDGAGDQAPAVRIGLLPSGDAAAATLASPTLQGSIVSIILGAVNPATGAVIGTDTIFVGELDVPELSSATDGRKLDYEVVSVFERLFEDDESARLSPGHHRSIFPNEAGMDYVTGVAEPVYWGVQGNPSPIVSAGGTPAGLFGVNARMKRV